MLWRTSSIVFSFFLKKERKKKTDTSAFRVFGPLFVAVFTIAGLETQTDSQQKSVKLRGKKRAKRFWMLTNAPPMASAIEQSTYKTSKLHKRLLQRRPSKALYVQLLLQRERKLQLKFRLFHAVPYCDQARAVLIPTLNQ